MKITRCIFILLLLMSSINGWSQEKITICSWNLKDLGRSKTNEEIEFIAKTVKQYDIVLVQEVVAKDPGGVQAIGRLGEALGRMGEKWDYRVSDITSGENSYKRERYAFLWKPSKAKLLGKPWLDQQYELQIDREPFMATFIIGKDSITLLNLHAITKRKQPETELKYLKYFPGVYAGLNIIFCGDFNLPQKHTVFNPLKKMKYLPAFTGQKTSLRKNCIEENCLSEEFDNMFYNSQRLKPDTSFTVPFFKAFKSMEEANHLSDHLPVVATFSWLTP